MCGWSVDDILLVAMYSFLLAWCVLLFADSHKAWSVGQARGLVWYILCTSLLCFTRILGFSIHPLFNYCNEHYKPWQWDIENRKYGGWYSFALVLVSSVPSGFFYTSYVFFAISLTKVIDLLTNAEITFNAINLFIGLNVCVWFSIFLLLLAALFELSIEPQIDRFAKVVVGLTSLFTCFVFSFHSAKAIIFLRSTDSDEEETIAIRAAQLQRLLRLNRVFGVCLVCTVCFSIRALFLLLHIKSNPQLEELYFIGAEIIPTCLMLYIFRGGDEEATDSVTDFGDARNEYKLLRQSIKDTLDITHSQGGTTRFRSFKSILNGAGTSYQRSTSIREPSDFLDRYSKKGMHSIDGTDDEYGDLLNVEDTIDDNEDSLFLSGNDAGTPKAGKELFSSSLYQI